MKLVFRHIIFDLGSVLVDVQDAATYPGFFDKFTESAEKVSGFFNQGQGQAVVDMDAGKINFAEFFELMKRETGYIGSLVEFRKDYCDWFRLELKRDVFDIIHAIKRAHIDVDLAILSNINELHWEYVGQRWPGLYANFRKLFASCHLKMIKPDPAIYRHVGKEIGAFAPNVCLFIDDREENCAGARSVGMTAYRFDNAKNLRAFLEKMFEIKLV